MPRSPGAAAAAVAAAWHDASAGDSALNPLVSIKEAPSHRAAASCPPSLSVLTRGAPEAPGSRNQVMMAPRTGEGEAARVNSIDTKVSKNNVKENNNKKN